MLFSAPASLIGSGLAAGLALEYSSGQRYAEDIQRYSKITSNSSDDVKITASDYTLANSRGVFDIGNPYDREMVENIARGIAIERSNIQPLLRTANVPVIDFKVMGRIDNQGHGSLINPYFDIDPNANEPSGEGFEPQYQPKSILFTPDDRDLHLEWSKLPGFAPSMVTTWQEGFDVHETDWKDSILEKRKHESSTQHQVTKFKDSTVFGMPDPSDLEPDDNEHSFDPRKEENHDKIRRDERYGKLYRDSQDSKIWYSKDRGGDRAHGGEHWKQFRQYGDELIHEADIDLTGKVMSKHKSNTGRVIDLKKTIGIK